MFIKSCIIYVMNRYTREIQTRRNRYNSRHNRIVDFSDKIQEAMGLSDEDARWAFSNDMSWDLPDFYIIRCSISQGHNVLIIETTSESCWAVKNPPLPAKQKEFLKLIKKLN